MFCVPILDWFPGFLLRPPLTWLSNSPRHLGGCFELPDPSRRGWLLLHKKDTHLAACPQFLSFV